MFLTIPKAAEALDVSERTVRRWISAGFLPTITLPGRTIRIPEGALAKLAWQYAPTKTAKAARATYVNSSRRGGASYVDALQALAEPKRKNSRRRSGAKSSPPLTLVAPLKSA